MKRKHKEMPSQADILATEQSVFDAEAALEDAKSGTPLSLQDIVSAEINLEAARDGLKRAIRIKAELFLTK